MTEAPYAPVTLDDMRAARERLAPGVGPPCFVAGLRGDLEQRVEGEGPLGEARVGQDQARLAVCTPRRPEQVEVQHAVGPSRRVSAAGPLLDGLEQLQQGRGRPRPVHPDRGVEEGVSGDAARGWAEVDAAAGLHPGAPEVEQPEGQLQGLSSRAQAGAQPDDVDAHGGGGLRQRSMARPERIALSTRLS